MIHLKVGGVAIAVKKLKKISSPISTFWRKKNWLFNLWRATMTLKFLFSWPFLEVSTIVVSTKRFAGVPQASA